MVDAVGVEQRTTALDTVDGIPFGQQEFGQIGAVLAGDTSDEGGLIHDFKGLCLYEKSPERHATALLYDQQHERRTGVKVCKRCTAQYLKRLISSWH